MCPTYPLNENSGFHPSERRREKRLTPSNSISVHFKKKGLIFCKGGRASVRDISMNGIRFSTESSLRKGDTLYLKLDFGTQFPGQQEIEIFAKVIGFYKIRNSSQKRVCCILVHRASTTREIMRRFMIWGESSGSLKSKAA